jgi:peptidyl-prolyl cis-trans isomerase D
MLDIMRRKKDSIVVKIVFVVIILSFVIAFGYGLYGGKQSSGTTGYAAKVDRTVITLDAYQNSLNNMRELYRQVFGQAYTPEIEKGLNIKNQALERLIDSVLVTKGAKELDIKVSKDDVAAAIAALPAFQRNGVFDLPTYQQTLRMNRITPVDFEESQKRELLQIKTRKAVMDKAVVTDEDALKQFHKEKDKRQLVFASFAAPDLVSEIKVTDGELTEYMEKNANRFKTPEKASISYLLVPANSSVAGVTATDEEVKAFYETNLDRYMGKDHAPMAFEQVKGQARVELIRQKAAKQLYEKVTDTFYQNKKSGDLGLVAKKLNARIQDTAMFTQSSPAQGLVGETKLLKKVFEVAVGELSDPVETAKGIYIFKVKEKKGAELPPLAQVRTVLEQQVKLQKASDLAKTRAVEAQKQLATTNHAGLKLQTTPLFGYSVKGEIPSIGISVPLAEKVAGLTAASPAPSEPVLIAGRWYAVRLKSHDVAPEAAFAAQKDLIKQQLLPKKQEQVLADWIKGLRDKAKIERNPSILAD